MDASFQCLQRGIAAVNPLAGFPWPVRCILAMEAAERYCYYGARACMALFLMDRFGWSEDEAIAAVYWYIALSYASPFLGGYCADVRGKYTTILGFGSAYIAGLVVLTATTFAQVGGAGGVGGAATGFLLMALGAGGIKPVCGPFGVDQLGPATEREATSFWLRWYWSINAGVFLAYATVPIVRQGAGFGAAFTTCLATLVVAAAVLLLPHSVYHHVRPSGVSVYATIGRVAVASTSCACCCASTRRARGSKAPEVKQRTSAHGPPRADAECAPLLGGAHVPSRAENSMGPPVVGATVSFIAEDGDDVIVASRKMWCCFCEPLCSLSRAQDRVPAEDIAGVSSFTALIPLFACLPLFWAVNDSSDSIWVIQRTQMDMCVLGDGRWCMPPDQFGILNPTMIIVLAPLFDKAIIPLLERLALKRPWLAPTPLRRMTIGMQIAALSFAMTSFVQWKIDSLPAGTTPVNVIWQLPMYVLMGVAEMMVSATGLEFAASQAPVSMRGSVIALFYASVFVGDAVSGSLFGSVKGRFSTLQLVMLMGAMTALSGLLFGVAACRYRVRNHIAALNAQHSDSGIAMAIMKHVEVKSLASSGTSPENVSPSNASLTSSAVNERKVQQYLCVVINASTQSLEAFF